MRPSRARLTTSMAGSSSSPANATRASSDSKVRLLTLWRHKLDAVSWAGLEHSLYIAVMNFDLWRQRHCWRRHAEFLEPSFKSSGSEQDEHPHLLRVNHKRVRYLPRQADHCPWCGLDRLAAN